MTKPTKSRPEKHRIVCLIGIALLFVLSLAKFAFDVRWLTYPVNDLTAPWVSSRAFVEGKNPYNDIQEFDRIWAPVRVLSAGGCADYNCILKTYPMAYPPSALPLVAPLTLLPWRAAVYVYLAGSASLVLAMILALAQRLRLPWSNLRKFYMIAFALAMAPLHSGIHQSNLNTAVIAFLGAGILFMERRPYLSGLALAIGMCLKPQVAFLCFAYPWLRRKWKTALTGLAACAAISASSLLWMGFHHVEWVRAYLDSARDIASPGNSAFSFYAPGPGKFQLIHLQVLAFQFTHNSHESDLVSLAVFLLLAIISAFLIFNRVSEKNEGIGVATISVLTLLPVYQRYYSGAILIFVIYWAFENWHLRKARAALLLMLPLLLPLQAMTEMGTMRDFVQRHQLGSYFFWNAVLMPHAVWIELFLALLLVAALYDAPTIRRTAPGSLVEGLPLD